MAPKKTAAVIAPPLPASWEVPAKPQRARRGANASASSVVEEQPIEPALVADTVVDTEAPTDAAAANGVAVAEPIDKNATKEGESAVAADVAPAVTAGVPPETALALISQPVLKPSSSDRDDEDDRSGPETNPNGPHTTTGPERAPKTL